MSQSNTLVISIIVALCACVVGLVVAVAVISTQTQSVASTSTGDLQPYVYNNGYGGSIFKFNVFNLDPNNVDQTMLSQILIAQQQDMQSNYLADWNAGADIKLYGPDDFTNPDLFNGDRIPIVIPDFDFCVNHCLGVHSYQNPSYTEHSFWESGSTMQDHGIFPPSNFPSNSPWIGINSVAIRAFSFLSNPAAFNGMDVMEFYQHLSYIISHEIHTLAKNPTHHNFLIFEALAPTVRTWRWGLFNGSVCVNSSPGSGGYKYLPTFDSIFPGGGFIVMPRENADPVAQSFAGKLTSYEVNGWSMANYPLPSFWEPYGNTTVGQTYDKLGLATMPLRPYFGAIPYFFFHSFDTNTLYFVGVTNFGTISNIERGALSPTQNFPPDYCIFYDAFTYQPNQDGVENLMLQMTHVHKRWEKIKKFMFKI